jgi:hypothetical protein
VSGVEDIVRPVSFRAKRPLWQYLNFGGGSTSKKGAAVEKNRLQLLTRKAEGKRISGVQFFFARRELFFAAFNSW